MKVTRIAHRHQDISGPHAHRAAAQLLVAIHAELVQLLGLSVALPGDVRLGKREDREEHRAEDQAGNGGFGLREQVHDRGDEQHNRDCRQSQRNLRFPICKFPGTFHSRFPGSVKRSTSTASDFMAKLQITPKA